MRSLLEVPDVRKAGLSIVALNLKERLDIAEEIIGRADTVTLLTCEEVSSIMRRAVAGEFDDFWSEGLPPIAEAV